MSQVRCSGETIQRLLEALRKCRGEKRKRMTEEDVDRRNTTNDMNVDGIEDCALGIELRWPILCNWECTT